MTTLLTDIEAALNASHLTDAQKNTLNSLKTRTSDKMNTLTPSSVRDPLETPTQQPPEKHAEAAAADTRSTKYYDLRLAADIELNTPVSREQIEALEKRLPLLYAQKKLPHFKTAVLGLLDKIEGTLLKSDGTTPRELLPPLKTDLAKLIIKTCMAPNTSDSPKISTFPHCKKILKEVFETAPLLDHRFKGI